MESELGSESGLEWNGVADMLHVTHCWRLDMNMDVNMDMNMDREMEMEMEMKS